MKFILALLVALMTMASAMATEVTTLAAPQAATGYPVYRAPGSGILSVCYGSITISANQGATTILKFCKLPAGATVLGGYFRGQDIDTGTETLDIDLGWAANGAEEADPDGFGNFGVLTGDVITDLMPEAGIYRPLNGTLRAGPVTFTNETLIQGVINANAHALTAGTLWVTVFYVVK